MSAKGIAKGAPPPPPIVNSAISLLCVALNGEQPRLPTPTWQSPAGGSAAGGVLCCATDKHKGREAWEAWGQVSPPPPASRPRLNSPSPPPPTHTPHTHAPPPPLTPPPHLHLPPPPCSLGVCDGRAQRVGHGGGLVCHPLAAAAGGAQAPLCAAHLLPLRTLLLRWGGVGRAGRLSCGGRQGVIGEVWQPGRRCLLPCCSAVALHTCSLDPRRPPRHLPRPAYSPQATSPRSGSGCACCRCQR